MITLLSMPKLSPTMSTGTIVKWHKKEGDSVRSGDVLLEIATDKAVLEHTSADDGFIRAILVKEKDKVQVGAPILVLSSEENESFNLENILPKQEAAPAKENEPQSAEEKTSFPAPSTQAQVNMSFMTFSPEAPLETPFSLPLPKQNFASPLARKIAKDKNLDLTKVAGSGPGGRVVKKDLENAPSKSSFSFEPRDAACPVFPGSYKTIPLSPLREVISTRLQAAKSSIPHFYVKQKVLVSSLVNLRKQLGDEGIKLSFNDFILRACALCLREFPGINSGFDSQNNNIVLFETIDISVAVSVNDGIITPIVRCADQKSLSLISSEVKNLAKKAKAGQLQAHEYKGGSFTLSNLGMTGITEFSAIINPPQAAILAVGGFEKEPVVINDSLSVGTTCCLTLSVDHRVIDGMEAALFMKRLQHLLENPSLLLLS